VDVWVVPVAVRASWPTRLRRTAFVVLPGVAALGSVGFLGPVLSDCVVGPAESISLTLRALTLLMVLLTVAYSLMFAVRAVSRAGALDQLAQVVLLVVALGGLGLAYDVLAPQPHVLCKNSPEYLR
jgi:hypothetical protein